MAAHAEDVTLGSALRDAREKRGWSTARTGEHFEVSQQLVSNWERGAGRPARDKVAKVAKFIGRPQDATLALWQAAASEKSSRRLEERVAVIEQELADLRRLIVAELWRRQG
jgi:transcriptional regulator with XRE-family HTH domain